MIPAPNTCIEAGFGAPEPADEGDWNHDPEPGAESDYYAGEEGTPCPVCSWEKPLHQHGCWIAGDFSPTYRYHSDDFRPGGRDCDKETY